MPTENRRIPDFEIPARMQAVERQVANMKADADNAVTHADDNIIWGSPGGGDTQTPVYRRGSIDQFLVVPVTATSVKMRGGVWAFHYKT